MKFELRFSKRSVQDIEEVLDHTLARFGERQFEQYQSLISLALQDIESDPRGIPAKRRTSIHRDTYTFHIARRGRPARHYFLYRIVDNQFVDIGRFLHDSMELDRHLPDWRASGR